MSVKTDFTVGFITQGMHNVAYTADGSTIAGGVGDGMIHLFDVATGKLLRSIKGSDTSISGIALSPDGKLMATTAVFEGVVRIWDTATGEPVSEVPMENSLQTSMNFSPDGSILAVSGSVINSITTPPQAVVSLFDTTSWKKLRTLSDLDGIATQVTFSPDGKTLAFGAEKGSVILWEVASGKKKLTIPGVMNIPRSVAFSPRWQHAHLRGDRRLPSPVGRRHRARAGKCQRVFGRDYRRRPFTGGHDPADIV